MPPTTDIPTSFGSDYQYQSAEDFFNFTSVDEILDEFALGPTTNRQAVTPENLLGQHVDGFYGGQDQLEQLTGPLDEVGYFSPEAAAASKALVEELKLRQKSTEEVLKDRATVANMDAKTFELFTKTRVEMLKSTLDQAKTGVTAAAAGAQAMDLYEVLARKHQGTQNARRVFSRETQRLARLSRIA
jgi:hypothetical protein